MVNCYSPRCPNAAQLVIPWNLAGLATIPVCNRCAKSVLSKTEYDDAKAKYDAHAAKVSQNNYDFPFDNALGL